MPKTRNIPEAQNKELRVRHCWDRCEEPFSMIFYYSNSVASKRMELFQVFDKNTNQNEASRQKKEKMHSKNVFMF